MSRYFLKNILVLISEVLSKGIKKQKIYEVLAIWPKLPTKSTCSIKAIRDNYITLEIKAWMFTFTNTYLKSLGK